MKLQYIMVLLTVFLLVGCSQTNDKSHEQNKTLEQSLKIAIVGTEPLYDFENIEWIKVNIDELSDNINYYDALFVMEETFSKTSQAKYAELYQELPYPTYFIGLNEPYEVFMDKDITITDLKESESMAFAQGYFKSEQGEKTWTFVPPQPLKSESDFRSIYKDIFHSIIEFGY
ncbi:hypothetical protein [Bacillus sp. AK128]